MFCISFIILTALYLDSSDGRASVKHYKSCGSGCGFNVSVSNGDDVSILNVILGHSPVSGPVYSGR